MVDMTIAVSWSLIYKQNIIQGLEGENNLYIF